MSANIQEWVHLLLRWFHIIAGIMWIGDSFYFMWLDSHLSKPEPAREQVEGELWMTHSGGFYRVEKRLIGPGQMPAVLHWFWSEATLTWFTGFFLLIAVYYVGGGAMLLGSHASISSLAAIHMGIGLLIVGWLVYDALMSSPLGKNMAVAGSICFGLVVLAAYELSHVFSGRATFMHIGALLGTCMVCNVWFRILPAQRQMIKATEEGRQPDLALGKQAKTRSIHNNYMTLPVIFVMISNHFPTLYGNQQNWLILILMFLAGGCIRYWFNHKEQPSSRFGLVAGAAIILGLMVMTMPAQAPVEIPTPTGTATGTTGTVGIHGVAHLDGTPPVVPPIKMAPGCLLHGQSEVPSDRVLVKDGLIQNVFVWISGGGLEGKRYPPPADEVKMDQQGCMYTRHVVGVQVGQKVTFVNDDNTVHNVDVDGSHGNLFNIMMTSQGDTSTQTFAADPKVMVHARCDIHPWMSAFIGVLPHPFFAVSDATGQYTISNVPPGTYTLTSWHEVFGQQSRPVTVGQDGTVTADLTFKAADAKL